jgi:hypothetical protein
MAMRDAMQWLRLDDGRRLTTQAEYTIPDVLRQRLKRCGDGEEIW